MKWPVLTGTAFLALAASPRIANSAPFVFGFTYTGNLVTFTVPTSLYQILAFGAEIDQFPFAWSGGRRSRCPKSVGLSVWSGRIPQITGGGAEATTSDGAGRGGGSFVVGPGSALVIAGGSGGGFISMPLPGQGGPQVGRR
jgi:hypothetical protein